MCLFCSNYYTTLCNFEVKFCEHIDNIRMETICSQGENLAFFLASDWLCFLINMQLSSC
uniref:Uncharacterized protein n=1 Tax=Arundo donax TaxID=35708 RepID=A0A0A9SCZ7_ARUDO